MSYDLTLRSDDQHSKSHDLAEVQRLVGGVLHVQISGAHAVLEDPARGQHMEIDLAWCDAEGNAVRPGEGELPSECNRVELRVPEASLHGDHDDEAYFVVAHALAAALAWQVYDPQEGRYLDPAGPHPHPRPT